MSDELRTEAVLIGRHLLGTEPPEPLIERYRQASLTLFPGPPSSRDGAVLDFIARHPRSFPMLEAATSVMRPRGLLRGKVVVMMAVLETTPELAARFEPPTASLANLIWRLAGYGMKSAVKIVPGLFLYAFFVLARR